MGQSTIGFHKHMASVLQTSQPLRPVSVWKDTNHVTTFQPVSRPEGEFTLVRPPWACGGGMVGLRSHRRRHGGGVSGPRTLEGRAIEGRDFVCSSSLCNMQPGHAANAPPPMQPEAIYATPARSMPEGGAALARKNRLETLQIWCPLYVQIYREALKGALQAWWNLSLLMLNWSDWPCLVLSLICFSNHFVLLCKYWLTRMVAEQFLLTAILKLCYGTRDIYWNKENCKFDVNKTFSRTTRVTIWCQQNFFHTHTGHNV